MATPMIWIAFDIVNCCIENNNMGCEMFYRNDLQEELLDICSKLFLNGS